MNLKYINYCKCKECDEWRNLLIEDIDEVRGCSICHYDEGINKLHHYFFKPDEQSLHRDKSCYMCSLCYGTLVGKTFLYHNQYDNIIRFLGALVNYNTNLILDTINNKPRSEKEILLSIEKLLKKEK